MVEGPVFSSLCISPETLANDRPVPWTVIPLSRAGMAMQERVRVNKHVKKSRGTREILAEVVRVQSSTFRASFLAVTKEIVVRKSLLTRKYQYILHNLGKITKEHYNSHQMDKKRGRKAQLCQIKNSLLGWEWRWIKQCKPHFHAARQPY